MRHNLQDCNRYGKLGTIGFGEALAGNDAKAQVQRLLADYRRQVQADPAEQTLLELEVAAIEQRSANRVLVDGLSQLAAIEPNLGLALETKMAEAGIQPPTEDADLDEGDDDMEM